MNVLVVCKGEFAEYEVDKEDEEEFFANRSDFLQILVRHLLLW